MSSSFKGDNPLFEATVYQDTVFGGTGNRKHRTALSVDGERDNNLVIYAFGSTPKEAYDALIPEVAKLTAAISEAMKAGQKEFYPDDEVIYSVRCPCGAAFTVGNTKIIGEWVAASEIDAIASAKGIHVACPLCNLHLRWDTTHNKLNSSGATERDARTNWENLRR